MGRGLGVEGTTVAQVMAELPAPAKRLQTQQDLARELWATSDTAARLPGIVVCRPKAFEPDEPDVVLREARRPKVHDWPVNQVVETSAHAEGPRVAWTADPDPVVTSAGRALNHCLAQVGISHRVHRARAIDIGERSEVLKDYPTPPDRTSPFAPVWIAEVVRRQEGVG